MQCANCESDLSVDIENNQIFCPFCGSRLVFDDETIKKISEVKEQAIIEQERTKQLVMQFKHKEKLEREKRSDIATLIMACALLLLFLVFSIIHFGKPYYHSYKGDLQIPISSSDLKNSSYEELELLFKENGFKKVETVPEEDLILGWTAKEGDVKSVSINGNTIFSRNEWVAPNAIVIIKYHSFKK